MPTGDSPAHTCINTTGWWPTQPCPACYWHHTPPLTYTFTNTNATAPISDSDVERIAKRVVELMRAPKVCSCGDGDSCDACQP